MDHSTLAGQALDEAALARLLVLAGPRDAAELMRRLITDLTQVDHGITASLAALDREALHRHTHVLLSVAGTLGAKAVYDLAQSLNRCAKDAACALVQRDATELSDRLQGLILRLRAIAAERGFKV